MHRRNAARSVPHRYAMVAAAAALSASLGACEKKPSPAGPSPLTETSIANLQIKQLGLGHEVCPFSPIQYLVIDELTFDIVGQRGADLVGATVHQVPDGGGETPLGPVEECPETFTLCQSASAKACLTRSSATGGTVRVRAHGPWTPQRQWRVLLRNDGTASNILTGSITRQDNLPFANAGIAYFEAYRSSDTSGSFALFHYSPGVSGRRFTVVREVWSNGTRLSTATTQHTEDSGPGIGGVSGGAIIASTPTEMIVTLEERDGSGTVIYSERKSKFFR